MKERKNRRKSISFVFMNSDTLINVDFLTKKQIGHSTALSYLGAGWGCNEFLR